MSEIPDDTLAKAGDILKLVANCRLVVTDTYHVAINAMALRIPVVCVYEPSPDRDRDANMGYRESMRDKRALLFSSTNQADWLMPADDLKNAKYRKHWWSFGHWKIWPVGSEIARLVDSYIHGKCN